MQKICRMKATLFTAILMIVGLVGMSLAVAQAEPSDQELKSFASAYLKVAAIQEAYAPRLESAQTAEQTMQLQQEASDAMVEAIEEEGLDVEAYNTVANAVTSDPELADRLRKIVERENLGN